MTKVLCYPDSWGLTEGRKENEEYEKRKGIQGFLPYATAKVQDTTDCSKADQ